MKTFSLIALTTCLWLSLVGGQSLDDAANCFTLDFYKKLSAGQTNLISSPFSADVLLSILLVGAGGTTADDLTKTLHFNNLPIADMEQEFKSKLTALKGNTVNTLNIASSIWIDKKFTPKQPFMDAVTQNFGAQVRTEDFANQPSLARSDINSWAKTATQGLIPSLFDEDLDKKTLMVLVNAIYFKGQWLKKFDKTKTQIKTFFSEGSKFLQKVPVVYPLLPKDFELFTAKPIVVPAVNPLLRKYVELFTAKPIAVPPIFKWPPSTYDNVLEPFVLEKIVPLMNQLREFTYKYDNSLKAQVLEMKYLGEDISMIVVLPNKGSKFSDLETALTCNTFKLGVLSTGSNRLVDVTLPKFEVTSNFDLEKPLKDVGLQKIFDNDANFSGITDVDGFRVSKAVQKAVVKVDEEGSEAAAAPGLGTCEGKRGCTSVGPKPVSFRADHPFLFLIRHNPTNLVLFIGRVLNLP